MKTLNLIAKASVVLFCISLLSGCSEPGGLPHTTNTIWVGPADLTVTNVSTGESRNKNSTNEIIINGSPDDIVFEHENTMQLLFTPPKDYKGKSFTVNYKVLDIDIDVTEAPYIYEFVIPSDVPTGTYAIRCSAMCNTWGEGSSCFQELTFRIE